jgi:hypothetical protein
MGALLDQYGMPLNTVSLADKGNYDRLKSIAIDLALQTRALTKKDIASWRRAWQVAIIHDNPRRHELYNVFTDTDVDSHLSGAIGQVNAAVKQRAFKIIDRKSRKEKPEITEIFENTWFKDLMDLVFEARYWGHSLIQLGDIITFTGKKKFANVELVPRVHVIPEFGVLLKDPSDEINTGINYREGKIADWVVEAGKSNSLGLFLKASPHAISKKNMTAFWDMFGEMFGMPIRIAHTSNPDPKEKGRIEKMLQGMGAAAWGLFPEGTTIDIKETTRGDAFEVYDRRISRANSEMSKLILTQTMTMDDGSSLSQSQVHEKMFKQTVEAVADNLRDIVNNTLIPKMIKFGFNISENDMFEWEYSLEYTPEQRNQLERNVLDNFEVDGKYFIENYNIPVLGPKQKLPGLSEKQLKDLGFFV